MVSTTANVLATIGTVCWCIQMIPQMIVNYKKKNTEGLPESMVLLWCLCAPFFAVFVVSEDSSIPIMIQPHLFGFFCWIVYMQVMFYPPVSRPKKQILLRGGGFLVFWIIIEIGFVIPLRKVYKNGTTWPSLVFGILASIILALGLIPPYFELAKRQGRVIGINFIFLLTDFSGAVFSLASLAVDPADLDIMGLVLYTICASLEFGIFVSQLIWLLRFRLFKNKSDELAEDVENKFDEDDNDHDNDNDNNAKDDTNNESDKYSLSMEITKVNDGSDIKKNNELNYEFSNSSTVAERNENKEEHDYEHEAEHEIGSDSDDQKSAENSNAFKKLSKLFK